MCLTAAVIPHCIKRTCCLCRLRGPAKCCELVKTLQRSSNCTRGQDILWKLHHHVYPLKSSHSQQLLPYCDFSHVPCNVTKQGTAQCSMFVFVACRTALTVPQTRHHPQLISEHMATVHGSIVDFAAVPHVLWREGGLPACCHGFGARLNVSGHVGVTVATLLFMVSVVLSAHQKAWPGQCCCHGTKRVADILLLPGPLCCPCSR